jgi:hypothetical protein
MEKFRPICSHCKPYKTDKDTYVQLKLESEIRSKGTKWFRRLDTHKVDWKQGCQIFLSTTYQNGNKYTEWPLNAPNGYNIYPMAAK